MVDPPSPNPFLDSITRKYPREFYTPLETHFGQTVMLDLIDYATEEVTSGRLNLNQSPKLPAREVINVMLDLSNHASLCIRKTQDAVMFRVILELLYRYAYCFQIDRGADVIAIRRSACSLADALLLNVSGPVISAEHSYLFTCSLRVIVAFNKLPRPAFIRMQHAEYVMNPLARRVFLHCNKNVSAERLAAFRAALSTALMQKYESLNDGAYASNSKEWVYSVLACLTMRLFGSRPQIFGSAAAGLATSTSDIDVTILLSSSQRRQFVQHAISWRDKGQADFCPFPAPSRRFTRVRKRKPKNQNDDNKGAVGAPVRSVVNTRSIGDWRWLTRSRKEIAAIWAGRMLSRRVSQMGWLVECVERARVPIIRITASVDVHGKPVPVACTDSQLKQLCDRNKQERHTASMYLDNTVCVGRDIDDVIFDVGGKEKALWDMSETEIRAVNRAIDRSFGCFLNLDLPTATQSDTTVMLSQELPESSDLSESGSASPQVVCLDAGFGHEVVVQNTKLMRVYAQCDPLVPILGLLLKNWTRLCHICTAYDGTLSGYQWMLMLIHFLQHYLILETTKHGDVRLPVLPNLQLPTSPPVVKLVDRKYNVWFRDPTTDIESGRNELDSSDAIAEEVIASPEHFFLDAQKVLRPVLAEEVRVSLLDESPSSLKNVLQQMRLESIVPAEDVARTCPTVVPDVDLYPSDYLSVEFADQKCLATAFIDFFDYFCFKFNYYTHVISICRTPQPPQRKTDCFNIECSPNFIAPDLLHTRSTAPFLQPRNTDVGGDVVKCLKPVKLIFEADDFTCPIISDSASVADAFEADDADAPEDFGPKGEDEENEQEDAACHSDSDSEDKEEDDEQARADKQVAHIVRSVQQSRSIRAYHNRQFLCILDPFEGDRTIGPSTRDGFTEILSNLLRVRSILLEAQNEFCDGVDVDMTAVVQSIFNNDKKTPRGVLTDTRPFKHPDMTYLNVSDRRNSKNLEKILNHIEEHSRLAPRERVELQPSPQFVHLPLPPYNNNTRNSTQKGESKKLYNIPTMVTVRRYVVKVPSKNSGTLARTTTFKSAPSSSVTSINSKRSDIGTDDA